MANFLLFITVLSIYGLVQKNIISGNMSDNGSYISIEVQLIKTALRVIAVISYSTCYNVPVE